MPTVTRTGQRSSLPPTLPAATARARRLSTPSAASRSPSSPASSWPSWARRAPGSRRSCTSSPRSTSRHPERSRSPARTSGALDDTDVTILRRKHIGFVFQFFNLLPMLSARGEHPAAALDRRREARSRLLRGSRQARGARRPAHAPSGRAVGRPAAARRDRTRRSSRGRRSSSPTSPPATSTRNTGMEILELLRSATQEYGQTTVMVTHDAAAPPRSPTASSSSPTG